MKSRRMHTHAESCSMGRFGQTYSRQRPRAAYHGLSGLVLLGAPLEEKTRPDSSGAVASVEEPVLIFLQTGLRLLRAEAPCRCLIHRHYSSGTWQHNVGA